MFVYQNKDRHICVTFTANKPVENPEYVIAVDEAAKALYMVHGTIEDMPETDEEAPVEEEVKVEVPAVEELDDVVENDTVREDAAIGAGSVTDAPAMNDLREKLEGEPEDANDKAPMTDADSTGAPSVEELDDVTENDPEVAAEEAAEEDVIEDEAE